MSALKNILIAILLSTFLSACSSMRHYYSPSLCEMHDKPINSFLSVYQAECKSLLQQLSISNDLDISIAKLSQLQADKAAVFGGLALILFADEQEEVLTTLESLEWLTEEDLYLAAMHAGIDPSKIFSPTAAGQQKDRITPLINSLSITLYDQQADSLARVRFKKSQSTTWQNGPDLQWEPMNQALSGVLVHLQANTKYDLNVLVNRTDGQAFNYQYQVSTRPNTPPINPDLIYQLDELYQGGQLDLSQLQLGGNETGWAKIVGNGEIIDAGQAFDAAINLGDSAFLVLDNIIIRGGRRHGIYARNAHHIWINACDIAQWGRIPTDFRKGIAYEKPQDKKPINYDAGIHLSRSGVVVIENCVIHSPNYGANNWSKGHPKGPSALLVSARHPLEEYQGQYIIRNNQFFGTEHKRFNDVIEGIANFRAHGAFIRDSAIHDNYFAYANDDIVELDGGQSNVLFYNNELEQGYCGLSLAPTMIGPNFIFSNFIHNLGDDRNKSWAAVKMGGLFAAPAGVSNLYFNKIVTNNNGIAGARVRGDRSFWLNSLGNVIITTKRHAGRYGNTILDTENFEKSQFIDNILFNTQQREPTFNANLNAKAIHNWSYEPDLMQQLVEGSHYLLNWSEIFPTLEHIHHFLSADPRGLPSKGRVPDPSMSRL